MSSIEQKIAELLDESKKAEEQIETLEESEGWKKPAGEKAEEEAPAEEVVGPASVIYGSDAIGGGANFYNYFVNFY